MQRIALPDADAEIGPIPVSGGGVVSEPELDRLSRIIRSFNEKFGNIPWADGERIVRVITEDIPAQVSKDGAYQNACRNSDEQNARVELDRALGRVLVTLMKDDTELFKQYSDNQSFRRWLADMVFAETWRPRAPAASAAAQGPA